MSIDIKQSCKATDNLNEARVLAVIFPRDLLRKKGVKVSSLLSEDEITRQSGLSFDATLKAISALKAKKLIKVEVSGSKASEDRQWYTLTAQGRLALAECT